MLLRSVVVVVDVLVWLAAIDAGAPRCACNTSRISVLRSRSNMAMYWLFSSTSSPSSLMRCLRRLLASAVTAAVDDDGGGLMPVEVCRTVVAVDVFVAAATAAADTAAGVCMICMCEPLADDEVVVLYSSVRASRVRLMWAMRTRCSCKCSWCRCEEVVFCGGDGNRTVLVSTMHSSYFIGEHVHVAYRRNIECGVSLKSMTIVCFLRMRMAYSIHYIIIFLSYRYKFYKFDLKIITDM